MKKIILFLSMTLLVASCADDVNIIQPNQSTAIVNNRDELKTIFGTALAKGLAESPALRQLIKNEALQMFDNDYDVLYLKIKDTKLATGQTVRELLLQYLESEAQLAMIEAKVPLMNIFVPSLPENSFSAETWDANQQIPSVGITSYKTNDVSVIDAAGNITLVEAHMIPSFPVVVVKENERVVSTTSKGQSDARSRTFEAGGFNFKFLSDCFDGSKKTDRSIARVFTNPDPKLVDAYFLNQGTEGWQRDYIYYNISPTQDRGEFVYDFQETIRSFTMVGDPTAALSKIADQTGDPKLRVIDKPNSGWTAGYFEFRVRVLLNAKNGLGEELVTFFSAAPNELFVINYTKNGWLYVPEVKGLKTKIFDLPLFAWDLDDYASTIKIDIEEKDLVTTTTTTETRSLKFAMNFGIDVNDGKLKKIGPKFGSVLEWNTSQSVQRTYTEGSDELGSVIVNFADNVLVSSSNGTWQSREYNTGWYSISVEPKRVQ
jgi:hypothetical protein